MLGRSLVWALMALSIGAGGCGSGTGTAPSGAATVKSVVVSLPSIVLVGLGVQATATAFLSDGTSTTSGFAFTSSATSVATVSATGVVSGVKTGTVNIQATIQGQSGSQAVEVLPNFQGAWTGGVGTVSCQVVSGPSNSCSFGTQTVISGPLTLSITSQTGATVTGTVTNLMLNTTGTSVALTFPVAGVVGTDGTLTLNSTQAIFGEALFDLQNWVTPLTPSGALSGNVNLILGALNEVVQLTIQLPSLTKSS